MGLWLWAFVPGKYPCRRFLLLYDEMTTMVRAYLKITGILSKTTELTKSFNRRKYYFKPFSLWKFARIQYTFLFWLSSYNMVFIWRIKPGNSFHCNVIIFGKIPSLMSHGKKKSKRLLLWNHILLISCWRLPVLRLNSIPSMGPSQPIDGHRNFFRWASMGFELSPSAWGHLQSILGLNISVLNLLSFLFEPE